jgi:hypothetical protein
MRNSKKNYNKDVTQLFNIALKHNELLFQLSSEDIYNINILDKLLSIITDSKHNDFSFLKGKGIVFFLYILIHTEKQVEVKHYNQLEDYLIANKKYILSENYENSFLYGKIGIIFTLTFFYSICQSEKIKSIIISSIIALLSQARFYKKGITWLPDRYNTDNTLPSSINKEVIFILNFLSLFFKSKVLDCFKESIIIENKTSNHIIKIIENIEINRKHCEEKKLHISEVLFNIFKSNFPSIVYFMGKKSVCKFLKSYSEINTSLNQYKLLNTLPSFINFRYRESKLYFKDLIKYQRNKSKNRDTYLNTIDEDSYYNNLIIYETFSEEKLFSSIFKYNDKNSFILSKYAWKKLSQRPIYQRNSCFYYNLYNKEKDECITFLRPRRFDNFLLEEVVDIIGNQILLFYHFYIKENTVNNFISNYKNNYFSNKEIRLFLLKLIRLGIIIPQKDV